MRRVALGFALAMTALRTTAAAQTAVAPAPEDRYLWLEDVTGGTALDWVRARNAETAAAPQIRG